MSSLRFPILAALFLAGMPSNADDVLPCGEMPKEPTLVDGSTADRPALVENSKAVKEFIANADLYLDCQEKRHRLAQESLTKGMVNYRLRLLRELTQRRNVIADEFNAEVANYKAAHPKK